MPTAIQKPGALYGYLLTFLGAIMFSTKAIIVKLAFAAFTVDAITLLTLRMVFSLPFFLTTAFVYSRKKDNVPLTLKQWAIVIVLGLFGYYISSLLDFMGLQYISAGLERLILFLYPTFVVFINAFIFKQPINRKQLAALVLTYMGIGLAYYGELQLDTANPNFYKGCFLVLLCAVTYSIYIAGSGKIIPVVGANKFTAYAMLAATAGIFIHYFFTGSFTAFTDAGHTWSYGLLLAIVATVLPSFFISNGMKRIGSNNVAIISSIGPVSTILQAHYFLSEAIFFEQIIGTLLVVAGVLLLGWKTTQ